MSIYKTIFILFSILAFGLFAIGGNAQAHDNRKSLEVITSPNAINHDSQKTKIFLAGSIEMGKAVDWQAEFINAFKDTNAIIYNPRRSDWNKDWKPVLSEPNFKTQVEWELNALEDADIIVMYLAPNTQSPISLLELGLYAKSGKLILLCPDEFWRKGNVDAVAAKYNIAQVDNIQDLISAAKSRLAK